MLCMRLFLVWIHVNAGPTWDVSCGYGGGPAVVVRCACARPHNVFLQKIFEERDRLASETWYRLVLEVVGGDQSQLFQSAATPLQRAMAASSPVWKLIHQAISVLSNSLWALGGPLNPLREVTTWCMPLDIRFAGCNAPKIRPRRRTACRPVLAK